MAHESGRSCATKSGFEDISLLPRQASAGRTHFGLRCCIQDLQGAGIHGNYADICNSAGAGAGEDDRRYPHGARRKGQSTRRAPRVRVAIHGKTIAVYHDLNVLSNGGCTLSRPVRDDSNTHGHLPMTPTVDLIVRHAEPLVNRNPRCPMARAARTRSAAARPRSRRPSACAAPRAGPECADRGPPRSPSRCRCPPRTCRISAAL